MEGLGFDEEDGSDWCGFTTILIFGVWEKVT